MAVCMDPQGMDNDASGVVSMADVGGWDCMLVNDLSAPMGSRHFWRRQLDLHRRLEP